MTGLKLMLMVYVDDFKMAGPVGALKECWKRIEAGEDHIILGDKTDIGGNDYEIYTSEKTESYKVLNPEDTIERLIEYSLKRI